MSEHRRAVELRHAYRLMNHGPTVLVSAAHAGVRNLMAAAWAMPLDFAPPKVAVVIEKSTTTRGLVEASGRFAARCTTWLADSSCFPATLCKRARWAEPSHHLPIPRRTRCT